jgi:Na+-translocating ferredoxin:NAD+ oxidoreductase RnfG subunit
MKRGVLCNDLQHVQRGIRPNTTHMRILFLALIAALCRGYTVADTAVSVWATVVKTTVKATGAVIDAVIPDSRSDKK